MAKPCVAFLLPNLSGGGAQAVTFRLIHEIRAMGVNTRLVVFEPTGPYLAQAQELGFDTLNGTKPFHWIFTYAIWLLRNRPDITLSALDSSNLVNVMASRLARRKSAIALHSAYSKQYSGALSASLNKRVRMMRKWYPRADVVIGCGVDASRDCEEFLGMSPGSVIPIPNPVITPEIERSIDQNIGAGRGNPPIIIGVGRLSKVKQFDQLIRAFAIVRQNVPSQLRIVGEGEERQSLEVLIEELGLSSEVVLTGYKPNAIEEMCASTVYGLTSIHEGLPTVLIEALAAGCSVVSYDVATGPREILEDGKYGVLVACDDYEAMAKAIIDELVGERTKVPDIAWKRYLSSTSAAMYLQSMGIHPTEGEMICSD